MPAKAAWLLLISITFSCNLDEDITYKNTGKFVRSNSYLREFIEENTLIYRFKYDSNRLVENYIYTGDETRSFFYEYDSAGSLIKIRGKNPLYDYVLYPVFSDSLLTELNYFINNNFRSTYLFEYDTEGRMVRASRISDRGRLLAETVMVWEGRNISEYELRLVYVIPNVVYKYEFEYDERLNPYRDVFRSLNYNLIEYLPISENNWITMVAYNLEYPQTRMTLKNTFAYSGPGYPFVRLQSAIESDGKKSEIYSEYKY
ncbi:MAG TPA: hypothetical protein VI583_04850 [Cyclobacteriaceae bacterium]|nr:hypothetical protein [Cyclobacteriaceae bacterium]